MSQKKKKLKDIGRLVVGDKKSRELVKVARASRKRGKIPRIAQYAIKDKIRDDNGGQQSEHPSRSLPFPSLPVPFLFHPAPTLRFIVSVDITPTDDSK